MDSKEMETRCQNAKEVGVAILNGHTFLINSRGVATIIPKPKEMVYGVLWQVTKADIHSLDRYEGVALGYYFRTTMNVECNNQLVDAEIYVASDNEAGMPRDGYLEGILASAVKHQFPIEYIQRLKVCKKIDA